MIVCCAVSESHAKHRGLDGEGGRGAGGIKHTRIAPK